MSESHAFGPGLDARTNTGTDTHTHTCLKAAATHRDTLICTQITSEDYLSHIAFCPLSEIVFIYSSVHPPVHSMTHYGYSVFFKQERGESDPNQSVSSR